MKKKLKLESCSEKTKASHLHRWSLLTFCKSVSIDKLKRDGDRDLPCLIHLLMENKGDKMSFTLNQADGLLYSVKVALINSKGILQSISVCFYRIPGYLVKWLLGICGEKDREDTEIMISILNGLVSPFTPPQQSPFGLGEYAWVKICYS